MLKTGRRHWRHCLCGSSVIFYSKRWFSTDYKTLNQTFRPGLYIIGTPIGNLRDMTLRGLDVLSRSSIIACEDTRVTIKLLNHYKIATSNKQLLSYSEGKYNQMHLYQHSQRTLSKIISAIAENGSIVSLCSDAGMPCISDPGNLLISKCHENNLPVYVCPGASATTSAVALSGFTTTKFIFEGFLPAKQSKRIELYENVKSSHIFSGYSLVFFESPTRVLHTIDECIQVFGAGHWCCICSELTKKFEKIWRGPLGEIKQKIERSMENEVRGEFTIVIAPSTQE
jgi:16S rRNA (cytidine1402-2'-O)-methyltransferase